MSKTRNTDYLYVSAYIRAKEASLLTAQRLGQMAEAASFDEAARILTECGYPELTGASDGDLEKAFAVRRSEVLADMEKLCPEKALAEAFRLRYDYHNAKVLVKSEGAGVPGGELLSGAGRVSPEKLQEAYEQEDWRSVPPRLAAAIREAKRTLSRTANPQLADIGIDKAYFAELLALTETLSDGFYTGYVRLSIDVANLKSAVRCIRGGMDEGVLRAALIPGGNIPASRIGGRVYSEGVAAIFTDRALLDAAAQGQKAIEGGALSPFERQCDNALTRYLSDGKYVPFGTAPVVAYLAALEGEIVAARMVLLGKRDGVSPEMLRERLRDSYV